MIRAVLFDLDETLLDRTTSLCAFLADQFDRHRGQLGNVVFADWRDRFLALDQRGHVHKRVVYPAMLAEFEGAIELAPVLVADYETRCPTFAKPFEGMEGVIGDIRARGLPIGIVTNGETDFQSLHVEALGLDRLVDAVLISQREGLRKPEAALFHRAAGRIGVHAEDCLFIGDNPIADILGAHNVGMKTAWFRCGQQWPADLPPPPGAVIDHLEEMLGLI